MGFTGQPLPVDPSANLPQGIRKRFEGAGLQSFLPYLDPYQTLAGAAGYRQAAQGLDIADAEASFMDALPALSGGSEEQNQAGLQQFLRQNPSATFSPMVQTYQKVHQRMQPKQTTDPFARSVAGGGPKALQDYRNNVAAGMEPLEAYSLFQAQQDKAQEEKSAASEGILSYISKGGSVDEWKEGIASGKTGVELLEKITNRPKQLSPSAYYDLREKLNDANRSIKAITVDDTEKSAAFQVAKGKQPVSEEDWREAWNLVVDKKKQDIFKDYQENALDAYKGYDLEGLYPAGWTGSPTSKSAPTKSPYDGGAPAIPPKQENKDAKVEEKGAVNYYLQKGRQAAGK